MFNSKNMWWMIHGPYPEHGHTQIHCIHIHYQAENVIKWSQTDFDLCDLWGDVRKNKSLYLEGKHKVSGVMKRTKVHCSSGAVKMVMDWQKDNHGISLCKKSTRREKHSKKLMMDFSVPFKSCTHTCITIQKKKMYIYIY